LRCGGHFHKIPAFTILSPVFIWPTDLSHIAVYPLSEVIDELRSLENSAEAAEASGSRHHDLHLGSRSQSLREIEPLSY
jgi:hypothetical protein